MTQQPEKRFDAGSMDEVFDDGVEDLPQMPPQDDIGWLRTPRRPTHERKSQAPKAPRSPSEGTPKPRKT